MSWTWAPAARAAAAAAAEGRRHRLGGGDQGRAPALPEHDALAEAAVLEHDRPPAPAGVGVDQLVALLEGEVDELARAVPAHGRDQRVVGVEDPVAVAGHGLDHHLLDR